MSTILNRLSSFPNCNCTHESQCIKQIVKWFWDNYGNIFASFDENLVGIKPRVRNLVSLLGTDCDDDVRMIGIWGMGGLGKTTVATVIYGEISTQFDGASFIESIREASQNFGLPHLQKKILSDVLMDQNLNVSHVYQGTQMLKQRLGCKKVLLVLDDVDHAEQLHALAGGHSWFGKGSRIIMTTRNEQLLKAHGVDKLYNAALLDEDEANQLFNKYAFKKYNRTEGYDELSCRVVRYAARLPLTLKVLGSFLFDRDANEWTSQLERLAKIPENETLETLKISYDGLQDIDKKVFLDISCFFRGWERDSVVRILECCEFNPDIGLRNLEQKALIFFSDDDEVQMHDLIQEMGRNIVNKLHPKEPEKRSRLWDEEDINNVLEKNMGTKAIEAIVGPWYPSYDSNTFMSMKKLRLLHLFINDNRNKWFVEEPGYLPNELQWISWDCYRHASLAESFEASKLVGLKMKRSSIVQLWTGKKLLDNLKFLDLSGSDKLIRTPDFSGIPNLKELNLSYCTSLIEVHPSIGDLQRLVLLDLSHCVNLVDFPSDIQMKSLEVLDFSHCWEFERFPELLGNMNSLSKLPLEYIKMYIICVMIAGTCNC